MDALARIEPVARRLLHDVDAALVTLGAPAEHPIWSPLRRLGVTPADAVAFFARARPQPFRSAGEALRERLGAYEAAAIPAAVAWHGAAGERYAARAQALNAHLAGGDNDSMTTRLAATASYVDDVAAWFERSRDDVAAALAAVLTSAQAVTLAAGGPEPTRMAPAALVAAADIGAHVLRAVLDAVEQAHELLGRCAWLADESAMPMPGDAGQVRLDATIHLRP